MKEYAVKNAAGDELAILEAADNTDAQLFAFREIKGAASVVSLPSSEALDAELREVFQRLGLSESGAAIATEGRGRGRSRVHRFKIGRQEATMPGIAPKRKPPMAAAGSHLGLGMGRLGESDTEKIDEELTEVFRRLGLNESAAREAAVGRERR